MNALLIILITAIIIMIIVVVMLSLYIRRLKKEKDSMLNAVSNLAHDLKSPIASSSGFIKAISDGTIDKDNSKHYINIVDNELDRVNRYIGSVLDSVRLENGTYVMKKDEVDVNAVINQIFLSMEKRLDQKGITVTGLDNDINLVYADNDFLNRAVYNLVDNAVKYTNEGGTISIFKQQTNCHLKVSIKNTGDGLSKDECKKVFDRYYRAKSGSKNQEKGLGLGLNITEKIIELCKGSVFADGVKGEYAEFVFTLPAVKTVKE